MIDQNKLQMLLVERKKQEDFKKPLKGFIDKSLRNMRELQVEYDYCNNVYQCLGRGRREGGLIGLDSGQALEALIGLGDEMGEIPGNSDISPPSLKACQASLFLQSKLATSEPNVVVSALTNSQSDIRAANFAKQFVKFFRKEVELDEVLEAGAYLNCVVKGTGIAHVSWNPYAGNRTEDGEVAGNFAVDDVAPEDFFIDSGVKTFREATKCMRRIYLPIDQAFHAFPDKKGLINKYIKKNEESTKNAPFGDKGICKGEEPDTIAVYEYWEKPLAHNDWQGKYFHFLDVEDPQYLTDIQDFPYEHGELPFAVLTDIDIPSSPYGMSRLVLASVTFDTLSTVYSIVLNNAMLHGQVHLLYPAGEIPEEVLSDSTYKAIPYSPHSGNRPEHLKPSLVSGDFWRIKEELTKEIDALYGMNEFSQGQVNRELSSYAVSMAVEADDRFRIRLFNNKKRFIQRIYGQAISLAKQFVGDSRWMNIGGADKTDELTYFKGSDLDGGYVLDISYGNYLPSDNAARKNQILELYKLGILKDANIDLKEVLSMLIDGDINKLQDFAESAGKVQDGENLKLSLGINIPVEKYQSHEDHLASLVNFMNSQEFESLDTIIKENFVNHREKHMDALAELTAGAAGGGGAPGAPAPEGAPKPAPEGGGALPPI